MSLIASSTQWLLRTTNVPTTFTVCAWCKAVSPSNTPVAFSLDDTTNFAAAILVNTSTNNNWWFFTTRFSSGPMPLDLGISSAVWTFLCITCQDNTTNGLIIYTGTGGALTVNTPPIVAGAVTATAISVFNETDLANPFQGNVINFKLWDAVLAQNEIEDEYLRMRPTQRLASLNTFLPALNDTGAILDWSGNGRNMTKTGTFTDSHVMPPIPWLGF